MSVLEWAEEVAHATNKTSFCAYQGAPKDTTKFALLIVLTPALCVFGFVGNAANIYIFTKKKMRSTNNTLLAALAVCDIGVLASALLVYTVEVAYDYYDSLELYRAWLFYLKFLFFISHVFQNGAIYMTIAATFERVIVTAYPKAGFTICSISKVWVSILAVVSWALVTNATKFFEIDVVHKPWCVGWAAYAPQPSALAKNPVYTEVYSVWISQLFGMIIPFMLLSVLNIIIIYQMKQHAFDESPSALMKASMNVTMVRKQSRVKLRAKRREATVVLLVVVFVFLLCNTPGFVLTIWERIDMAYLEEHKAFYGSLKDTITILTIINSVANFVVYMIFGNEFRREVQRMFCPNVVPESKHGSYRDTSSRQSLTLANELNRQCDACDTADMADFLRPPANLTSLSVLSDNNNRPSRRVTIIDQPLSTHLLGNGDIPMDDTPFPGGSVTIGGPIECMCGCPSNVCHVSTPITLH